MNWQTHKNVGRKKKLFATSYTTNMATSLLNLCIVIIYIVCRPVTCINTYTYCTHSLLVYHRDCELISLGSDSRYVTLSQKWSKRVIECETNMFSNWIVNYNIHYSDQQANSVVIGMCLCTRVTPIIGCNTCNQIY